MFLVFAGASLLAALIWLGCKNDTPRFVDGRGASLRVPAAIGLGQYVSTQLYGVQANDPWMAVGTTVVLAAVSVAAGVIPARRASRIDPILALRFE